MTFFNIFAIVGIVLSCAKAVSLLWAAEPALSIALIGTAYLAISFIWEER